MRLPGANVALVEAGKLSGYLLNPGHREGGSKARFFLAGGFTIETPHVLRAALLEHPLRNEAVRKSVTAWGEKYEVRCRLRRPDGRDPCIVTAWIVEAGRPPRLVTAYPS